MTISVYSVILLLCVVFVCLTNGAGEHRLCLSCPRLSNPCDCQTVAEVWPHEQCSTQRFLLLNGSTVYKFGYTDVRDCTFTDGISSGRVRRQEMSHTDILECDVCCTHSLCNRRLCGIHEPNNTNLVCLSGEDVGDSQSILIAYCQEGESCYAGIHTHNYNRPHPINYVNYGCASQALCDRIQSGQDGAGSSELCQKCCSQDGCNAHVCQLQVQESSTTVNPGHETSTLSLDTTQLHTRFNDCFDLHSRGGYTQTAVYDIYPPPTYARLRVRCDMTTAGGGWTVLQRRFDGSLNFTRSFMEYEEGFGFVSGEHWLGLRWIHSLTSQNAVHMRVDLCRFDDQAGYIVYDGFSVSGPGDNYTLHAGVYRNGSMSDYLSYHNAREFQASGRCADRFRGGWWYTSCFSANLNGGRYNGGSHHGIMWRGFGGHSSYHNVRSSEVKIRPLNAPGDPTHPYTCPP